MLKNWLSWMTLSFVAAAGAMFFFAFWLWVLRPGEIPVVDAPPKKTTLPRGSFTQDQGAYNKIGEPLLHLEFAPLSMQLPDLRRFLVYYGRNARPDVSQGNALLHFAFTGQKETASVAPGDKLYLVYDKNQPRIKYAFSPSNIPTSLWIEASPKDKVADVTVGMVDEGGNRVNRPTEHEKFPLQEREFGRFGGSAWEIGKFRVDGTLLARQRARWYGSDKFLAKHGGEEYANRAIKQRIDFGEAGDIYSIYVGVGDVVVWDGVRWKEAIAGTETMDKPLLDVKSIDERLMKMDVWDANGKAKVSLNLLKSTETWIPQNIQQSFKFVGARTRSQFVFEINKERVLISPQDWLLMTDKGWKKLVTAKEIDDYVERRVVGPLFVFDGVTRKDGQQVLQGTLFNAARTDARTVLIPIQQGAVSLSPQEEEDEGEEPSIQNDEEEVENEKIIEE